MAQTKSKASFIPTVTDLQSFVTRGLATQAAVDAATGKGVKVIGGSRKLRKHREPNQTESDFALQYLETQKRSGAIIDYWFEGITLRWADQEYTPDYLVIVNATDATDYGCLTKVLTGDAPARHMIEVLFIELKGGHKWQRNVNTFKTFREQMAWARFEMWERLSRSHGWEQLA